MLCQCGCGGLAPLAKQNETKRGYIKGQPVRWIVGHNHKGCPIAPGRYKQVYKPSRATGAGCIVEHVVIAERVLGRMLPAGAEVHHVDGTRDKNTNANLVICQDKAYHKLLHVRTKTVRAGGDPNTQKVCGSCGTAKKFDAFNRASANKSTGRHSKCRDCSRRLTRAV